MSVPVSQCPNITCQCPMPMSHTNVPCQCAKTRCTRPSSLPQSYCPDVLLSPYPSANVPMSYFGCPSAIVPIVMSSYVLMSCHSYIPVSRSPNVRILDVPVSQWSRCPILSFLMSNRPRPVLSCYLGAPTSQSPSMPSVLTLFWLLISQCLNVRLDLALMF